jgi:hypothetical protein
MKMIGKKGLIIEVMRLLEFSKKYSTLDTARCIIENLIKAGWKSPEEVEEIEDKWANDFVDLHNDIQEQLDDCICPEAQISDTCPDCGGLGRIKAWPDAEPISGLGMKFCPTCNGSGEVGAWVRCEKSKLGICTIHDTCEKVKACNISTGLIPLTNKLALERMGEKYEIIKKGVKG